MSTLEPSLPRTCTACGGRLQPRETRAAFFEGERLVVVEGIPGLVCRACGNEPFEATAAVTLGLLRGESLRAAADACAPNAEAFRFGKSPFLDAT